MIGIIFLSSCLVICIALALWNFGQNIKEVYNYNKAEKNVQIGDKYRYTFVIRDSDPFCEPITINVVIIDKKYNSNGELWVKYEYEDGSTEVKSFESFYENYEKIDNGNAEIL